MNDNELIEQGNQFRAESNPVKALECYATVLTRNPDNVAAFNNYGNVLRECGFPERGLPFLQCAVAMAPGFTTAKFNIAVAQLLMGDYANGFKSYEARWDYEHLAGQLPQYPEPRWTGEDLTGKTILVVGEQGHGDNIQFSRFIDPLIKRGARVIFHVALPLINLFPANEKLTVLGYDKKPEGFDYWTPIMSVPGVLGVTLDNLERPVKYLTPDPVLVKAWLERLGPKKKLRVGFAWSGRRDSWINQHKAMPFSAMLALIRANPEYEWINLQADCTDEEKQILIDAGVVNCQFNNFSETAALMIHLDVVLSVDTAVAHLAGALGVNTWVLLNHFGLDWRWLLRREDSPWYLSARLFRQPSIGNWAEPLERVHKFLKLFKI